MPISSESSSRTADRLSSFGSTIFAKMSRLAAEHGAVNLSQGFPDFDGPAFLRETVTRAMFEGHNQYARMYGEPALTQEIAAFWQRMTGVELDPDAQVTVTSGCTEAIASTFMGLINLGEEVILFEPFYDSYLACVSMAGATPRFVTLRAPAANRKEPCEQQGGVIGDAFTFDPDELRRAFTSKTKAILVNTPHNPTGKVFTKDELKLIAELCIKHDVIAITDEVYERLVYESPGVGHIRLATLPGMADRTVTLSSLGKTYSMTGWKIGWAIASTLLTRAVRASHQFITYATATPLQYGAAAALRDGEAYVTSLVADYHRRRDLLADGLAACGFTVYLPAGSYFILADHTFFGFDDDASFCQHLIEDIGVAAIPPSSFYDHPEHGARLVRFAFCKKDQTLQSALDRLSSLRR